MAGFGGRSRGTRKRVTRRKAPKRPIGFDVRSNGGPPRRPPNPRKESLIDRAEETVEKVKDKARELFNG
jgi:hypothetical protein